MKFCADDADPSFPYEAMVFPRENTPTALMWCHNTINISDWRYLAKGSRIAFKNEKDLTLFLMRWE